MTKEVPQDVLDFTTVQSNPIICMYQVDWPGIRTGSVRKDTEQGRQLAIHAFKDVNWSDHKGSLTVLLSNILINLPQDKRLHYVVQGFTDALTSDLMKAMMGRKITEVQGRVLS